MKHIEKRILNHTSQNLFNLVSDVNKYPDFLPWCLGARVKNFLNNEFDADLIIGFKIYKEIYSSQILLDPNNYKITSVKKKKTQLQCSNILIFSVFQKNL